MGELKKEAVYISRGVESTGTDYLKKLNDEDSRITYVDEEVEKLSTTMRQMWKAG